MITAAAYVVLKTLLSDFSGWSLVLPVLTDIAIIGFIDRHGKNKGEE